MRRRKDPDMRRSRPTIFGSGGKGGGLCFRGLIVKEPSDDLHTVAIRCRDPCRALSAVPWQDAAVLCSIPEPRTEGGRRDGRKEGDRQLDGRKRSGAKNTPEDVFRRLT